MKKLFASDSGDVALIGGQFTEQPLSNLPVNHQDEAVSALIALGYTQVQASKAVKGVYQEELSSEELIRFALKAMV